MITAAEITDWLSLVETLHRCEGSIPGITLATIEYAAYLAGLGMRKP